jgi:GT2 family glycosyltransferase
MRTTISIRDPLFVSCPNGGGLLFVHKHLLMPLFQEEATGLTPVSDGLLWCVQANGSRSLRRVSDGRLHTIPVADTTLDLHDVLATSGGTYAVFTETNQVVLLDDDYREVESWRFGDEPDSAHVNCIAIHDGRLLASMFGQFHAHRGYKGATRRAGMVIDVRSGKPLIEGLSQPHSLVSVGGELWLCSSEDQSVRIYDEDYQLKKKVSLPGYTRGLAVCDEHVYVGLSQSRNTVVSEVGAFGSAMIAVLDRRSLEVMGFVPIPYNEIYDIRVAPSTFAVTDVMAALWSHERAEQAVQLLETGQSAQAEIADAVQRLAHAEIAHQRADTRHQLAKAELSRGLAEEQAAHKLTASRLARELEDLSVAHQSVRAGLERELEQLKVAHNSAQEQAARQAIELNIEIERLALVQRDAESAMEKLHAELLESEADVDRRESSIQVLERQLDQITTSRSWRLTWPMRAIMYLLRGHGLLGKADHIVAGRLRQRVRRIRDIPRNFRRRYSSVVPGVGLAMAEISKRDVFVWSVIDWNYRTQRPQHLARELAVRGHRVFYVSNNFIDQDEPGFAIEPLDSDGLLFRVQLYVKGSPAIYYGMPSAEAQKQLRASIGRVLAWTCSRSCLSLVEHPFWVETARVLPNQRLVYDCMDHHAGFDGNSPDVLASEIELMRAADLLVVTSDWLYSEAGKHNPSRLMVRNACQHEHFAAQPEHIFKDKRDRKIIGYYGAIAKWIDLDLLEKVAEQFADCLILMVGDDTAGARQRLRHLANVEFTGEVPYATLPFYLSAFDVCMLPFQVIPLTLATNPVKVYEYLSAGKEVVCIALPEIRQFGELVRTGVDHASFLDAVGEALSAPFDPAVISARQQFAAGQTWANRVDDLVQGVAELPEPRVSVIVVTYNNLDFTQACLHSLELYSDYANLEVIVVDNASTDGTPAYLTAWAANGHDRHVILNADNLGFAAANNQGLAMASGEYLVLLNNDTYVTPGWIATLASHLRRRKTLGMIGPVTNNIGNEARIDIQYNDMDGMLAAAVDYTARHAGQLTPLRTAAFFCVMLRRAVYEKVGPLDEAFGIGFFEDDDYCRRVEQAGWTIACADDVFVHHHLSASFSQLKHERRQAIFERNKAIYEEKWGEWIAHSYREA